AGWNSSAGMSARGGKWMLTPPFSSSGLTGPAKMPGSISVIEVEAMASAAAMTRPAPSTGSGKASDGTQLALTVPAGTATSMVTESETVTSAVLRAVTVTEPSSWPVTTPFASTVAMLGSLLSQVTVVATPLPADTSAARTAVAPCGKLRSPPKISTLTTPWIDGPPQAA